MQVQITVIPGPHGPTLRERAGVGQSRTVIACLLVAALGAGGLVVGISTADGGRAAAAGRLPTTVLPGTVLYPTYLRYTGPMDPSRTAPTR